MECSSVVTSSHHSVASPDGEHIATLHSTHFSVRKSTTLDLVSSIPLPTKRSQFLCLRWSPTTSSSHPSRLLLATTTAVHVYSLESPSYHATISNGSGGLGPISHAEFGADESEVLVWTAMGASVCVWSIETGRMIAEWRDPKFFSNSAVIGRGCAWSGDARECLRSAVRERGVLALITRSGPQDTLTLYAPHDYAVVKTLILPTSDAQGVKWSPNGRWLAVWDAAGMAYKVLIYTADGNLFRTYEGEHEDDDMQGLGVKKVEWSPNGTHFAISGWDSRLTLLNTRTFSPVLTLANPAHITPTSSLSIYQELATSVSQRSYVRTSVPISPPIAMSSSSPTASINTTVSTDPNKVISSGISLISFSPTGEFLAMKDDSMPTVIFIWDFRLPRPALRTVLLQHNNVRKLAWWADPVAEDSDISSHELSRKEVLMITTEGTSPGTVYLYDTLTHTPCVLSPEVASGGFGARVESSWLPLISNKPSIMLGGTQGFMLIWPEGRPGLDDVDLGFDVDLEDVTAGHESGHGDVVIRLQRDAQIGKGENGGKTMAVEEDSVFDITTNVHLGDDTFQHKRVLGGI